MTLKKGYWMSQVWKFMPVIPATFWEVEVRFKVQAGQGKNIVRPHLSSNMGHVDACM
jgi:hypothetical protein